ncbi:LpqN/LpqT family lipoprotein [Mycobacterium sp. IDR2000157661]|uniref:LpqN/LpqT family lipoprotein n=1 Tax=Mycobacterium sp. IDR2000157661 TaxID=2867005 RepID=UPI001EEF0903|nr:LpqN/LpqT family lipoprotein [Mycobacterium sp. IDR2000157661]ULE34718.1 LpqN/LpqT family lipoprotein [Mycobacterium sp. IDR2000157661]
MIEIAPRWRILAAGAATATAGVLGFAGTTASAEPLSPLPPQPAPATVTQTVTVAPQALTGVAPAAVAPAAAPVAQAPTAVAPGLAPAALPPAAVPPAAGAPAAVAPVAQVPAIQPARSGTLTEFFESKGVRLEPQSSRDFKALNIVLPMPRGWAHVPDPNVPDAFAVIADRVGGNGLYTSNAQVVVYKLVGDFEPDEAISHGFVDSQQLPAWRSTDASLAQFGGMPSALIEGTYRDNAMTLNTSRRHVIATAGPDRYLVSLAVTTSLDQVVPAADATDAIVNGFRVSVPAPPGATPPPPPAPATAPAAPAAPVASAAPQLLGLPG